MQTSQIKQSTLETTALGYHHPDLRSCTWVVGGREKNLREEIRRGARKGGRRRLSSRRSLESQRQGRQRAGSADSASNGHNDGDNKNMGGESLVNDERKKRAALSLSLSDPLCADLSLGVAADPTIWSVSGTALGHFRRAAFFSSDRPEDLSHALSLTVQSTTLSCPWTCGGDGTLLLSFAALFRCCRVAGSFRGSLDKL